MKAGGQMPLFRQIPKRGFSNAAFRCEFQVVNVQALEDRFESGTHVTPEALQGAGLIRRGRVPVKILGEGDLTKPLKVDAAKFSRGAAEKIVAAGGEARVV
jgi:large subunit ribosomal protein L15